MAFQLAQINIGRLVAPIDDPRLADFVAQLDPVNQLAEAAPGFVWRLQSDSGNATDVAYGDDPLVIVNMSVWESLAALRDYTYASHHMQVFRERAKWFEKMDRPKLLPVVGSGGTPAHGGRRQGAAGALSGSRGHPVRFLVLAELPRAGRPGNVRLNSPRR